MESSPILFSAQLHSRHRAMDVTAYLEEIQNKHRTWRHLVNAVLQRGWPVLLTDQQVPDNLISRKMEVLSM